jgi:glutaminase
MVKAGAIAATSLAPGSTPAERWAFLHEGLSRFAGRDLALDENVFALRRRRTRATKVWPSCC